MCVRIVCVYACKAAGVFSVQVCVCVGGGGGGARGGHVFHHLKLQVQRGAALTRGGHVFHHLELQVQRGAALTATPTAP